LRPTAWRTILARLRRARLLAGEDPDNPGHLDAHPLVREYFGEQLRSQQRDAWKECNRRLYHYYRTLAPQLPNSFREMEPLFSAVICGCNAALFREALHEVYIPRIQRGNAYFAANVLGARGALLSVLVHFFEHGRWGSPVETAVEEQSLTAEDQSAEDFYIPIVGCLVYVAVSEWHHGDIASCRTAIAEAISLAKGINDTNALALALNFAAQIGHYEHNPAEVDRFASDLIELSNRHNFVHWLAIGGIHRGWARIASGDTAEGISFIEHGIRDFRATGSVLGLPYHLAQKAEALHLADRTSEALEAINEAEALAEKFEQRFYFSELHRLRGVFLATVGADEMQIEASFCAALRIAREQKSIALAKVAEATYAAYCRQKANASGGRGFRLPLW
jgi:hypothetical protein